ncbi:MAG: alkaline shock response membrane anchor protein AmaP [Kiritimatiellia bacterium]
MRKLLHRLSGLALFAGLIGVSISILNSALNTETWTATMRAVQSGRVTALFLGVGLLCLTVLFLLTAIPAKKRGQFLSFDQEGGTVSISTGAIANYVAKLSDEFPSITRMRPEIITGRNSIDVVVNVRIKAGPDIHEICEALQQRVRQSITSGLGIADVRSVEVKVDEIAGERRAAE